LPPRGKAIIAPPLAHVLFSATNALQPTLKPGNLAYQKALQFQDKVKPVAVVLDGVQ